jgi:3-dehydroquinate dehydratase / shikimate dehydrogenase
LSGRAGICLVLASRTLEENLRRAEEQRGRIDLVELRADHLLDSEAAAAAAFPARVGVPCILTVRRRSDGGVFAGTEPQRIALLKKLVGSGFSWVDLEEDLQAPELDAAVRAAGVKVVRSLHDFSRVPAGLSRRISVLARGPAEIAKAAVTPRSSAELAELLEAFRAAGDSPRVILGMGEIGFPTRVLASRLGSSWCYASPTAEAVAPGQVTPETLHDVYRFRSIGPDTQVFGVIGNPVMHSRSPLIHNRGYESLGIDAVYLPFHVPDLGGFWKAADLMGIRGLSVTVPHKTAVIGPLVHGDEDVRVIGACNTLFRSDAPGPWSGANTDMEGFLAPLRAALGGTIPPGFRATVIGAGGAARSVVSALRSAGARVLVCNRTVKSARLLAESFGASFAGLDPAGMQAAGEFADLIVQTTSAGMPPQGEVDPVPALRFTGREIVYELVYSPASTLFSRRAKAAGCVIIPGWQMLLAQARRQFLLFTGVEYPPEVMESLRSQLD